MEIDWVEVLKSVGIGFIAFFLIALLIGLAHLYFIFTILTFLMGLMGLIIVLYFIGLGVRKLLYNIMSMF